MDVHLAWDPNAEPDIINYNMYFGPSAGNYTSVGSPQAMGNVTSGFVTLPGTGAFHFALKAVSTSGGESVNYSLEAVGVWPSEAVSPRLSDVGVKEILPPYAFPSRLRRTFA